MHLADCMLFVLQKMSDAADNVSDIPFGDAFREKDASHQMKLKDYVAAVQSDKLPNRKSYWFFQYDDDTEGETPKNNHASALHKSLYSVRSKIFDLLGISESHKTVERTQHILGPQYSGSPQHTHARALNFVFGGAKLWSLSPTRDGLWSNKAWAETSERAPSWKDSPEGARPSVSTQCVQRAGDIMFVPDDYPHATVNLGVTQAAGWILWPAEDKDMDKYLTSGAAGNSRKKLNESSRDDEGDHDEDQTQGDGDDDGDSEFHDVDTKGGRWVKVDPTKQVQDKDGFYDTDDIRRKVMGEPPPPSRTDL